MQEESIFRKLLTDLKLDFKDPNLLETAFTHRSFLNESKQTIESNERLEFLGDSILSFIISNKLYALRKGDTEGDLTNLRAFIVKTKSLSEAAKKLNLGEYLKLSKGEDISGGRLNPQLLANTYEALLGAVFLDQGLEVAKRMVDETLIPLYAEELKMGPPKDSKSQLQEVVQNKVKESPHYKILDTKGPDHAKKFLIGVYIQGKQIGQGSGSSKQEAEEEAAANALLVLGET